MVSIPLVPLNSGAEIPQVGFGVFLVPPAETKAAVASALEIGYRHIDTARLYDNEEAVGEALAESGIPRNELFITTKCWNDDQGFDRAKAAFDTSLDRLGLDYVDLFLIHWPCPKQNLYVETWRAFEEILASGRSTSIGVSNFQPSHLQRLIDETDTVPAVNQVELHPQLQQKVLRDFHKQHGIVTEAWSPLARGGDILSNETVVAIADRHNVTPAQVILRWHLDLDTVIIPKSVNPERMASNLDLFRIRLDDADHERIAALDEGSRIGPDPDRFS